MKPIKRDIYSTSVKDRIYSVKHGKGLKIKAVFGNVNYYLTLISERHISDIPLIKLLALWRKKHEQLFLAIFPITLEGTKQWLRERVINEPDRILFMIEVKNQYIGHIGLYRFNFQNMSYEIDNNVRGVDRYPGIMGNALRHMMRWAKIEFGVNTFNVQTTSNNKKALRLYQRLGFVEAKRIPMIRIVKSDRIEWQNAPGGYKGIIKLYRVVMNLPHEKI